jgi:hypothetical protein
MKEGETGRACSTNGGILVAKPEGKRPLGRQRFRWMDNIEMVLRDGMGWYGLN